MRWPGCAYWGKTFNLLHDSSDLNGMRKSCLLNSLKLSLRCWVSGQRSKKSLEKQVIKIFDVHYNNDDE